jgi:hypothetical protein
MRPDDEARGAEGEIVDGHRREVESERLPRRPRITREHHAPFRAEVEQGRVRRVLAQHVQVDILCERGAEPDERLAEI